MKERSLGVWIALGVLLVLPMLLLAQGGVLGGLQSVTLTVNGRSGTANLVKVNGKTFIDLEKLVSLANGSIASDATQVILILPGSGNAPVTAGPPAPSGPSGAAPSGGPSGPASNPQPNPGLSREFLRAGIEEMAAIRAWRAALSYAVQQAYPVTEAWISSYQAEAAENLRMASLAVVTDSDRQAQQLLANEFNFMKKLSNKYVQANKNMTYISPNTMGQDPLDQKIVACAHSLAAMASSGQYMDDGSCQ